VSPLSKALSQVVELSATEGLKTAMENATAVVSDALKEGDYETAANAIGELSNQIMIEQMEIDKQRQEALKTMLPSQVESIFGESKYKPINDILKEQIALRSFLANVKKTQIDYTTEVISYNNALMTRSSLYDELIKKQAEGLSLTTQELDYLNNYESALNYLSLQEALATSLTDAIQISLSTDYSSHLTNFTSAITSSLQTALQDSIASALSPELAKLTTLAATAIQSSSTSLLYQTQQSMLALTTKTEKAQNSISGLLSMFDTEFTDNKTTYTASSSKDITYNISQTINLTAGALIGDNVSMKRLANELAPHLKSIMTKV
jgi:hypothetical protein